MDVREKWKPDLDSTGLLNLKFDYGTFFLTVEQCNFGHYIGVHPGVGGHLKPFY